MKEEKFAKKMLDKLVPEGHAFDAHLVLNDFQLRFSSRYRHTLIKINDLNHEIIDLMTEKGEPCWPDIERKQRILNHFMAQCEVYEEIQQYFLDLHNDAEA